MVENTLTFSHRQKYKKNNFSNHGLGTVLKLLRIANDMTIKHLASLMEVSPTYISEIESCIKKPSLNMISKYSKVLNVNMSTILYFDERGEEMNYQYQHLLLEILSELTKEK